jgi:hypothetical protein
MLVYSERIVTETALTPRKSSNIHEIAIDAASEPHPGPRGIHYLFIAFIVLFLFFNVKLIKLVLPLEANPALMYQSSCKIDQS